MLRFQIVLIKLIIQPAGFACFVCEGDNQIDGLEETDSHSCLKCKPPHTLNINKPQTVLTHMGIHILYDSTIHASNQPCGFCCRPFPMCHFVLKRTAEGLAVNVAASHGCMNFVKRFNYNVAATSSVNSPCSNVPMCCPECDTTAPAVWRYNLKYHLGHSHPRIPVAKHKDLWELSESEKVAMQNIWKKLKEPSKKATRKKKPQTTLKISAAHSSRRALV
ncbi:hypothetical protein B0H10DRAFT_1821589 [Mycena sp. CBHHK59/15]|nr:hypothetical protein B0H10DRAFT_1821589 [Mycena sp. CBHHK59/15]